MVLLTAVVLEPVMVVCVDVPVYEPLVMPYWNNAVVVAPLGIIVPFSMAELRVTLVAEPVVTVGAEDEVAFVTYFRSKLVLS